MKQSFFSLIHEDENIAVFNKSSGIAVTPERWGPAAGSGRSAGRDSPPVLSRESLDRLAAEYLHIQKLYTVHRIDKDTSGLVVFAKNSETHKALSLAFENRHIKKRYIAAVHGRPSWKEKTCDLPLIPNGNKQHLTIIDKYRGKKSLTAFRLLGGAGNYSIMEALPETGRTHQIRVHLASLGHPVVCDELYGSAKPVLLSSFKRGWRGDPLEERPLLSRLGLHAAELVIPEGLTFRAPLPKDMAALIRQMEKAAGEEFGV